jgi:multidrug efflux pump
MFAKFFIDRPIFASVLSILVVLTGLVAMYNLPIEQNPDIVPPVVQISARYPGADAETVAQSVAAPIEQQLSGAKGLIYFRSLCSNDGTLNIAATFDIGTNQDIAAVEVQNRLSIAQPRLPQEVVRNGITVTKASTNILAVIALKSNDPRFDEVQLSNYATINVLDAIRRVPGVGDGRVFGGKEYAMRVWVNPDRLVLKNMTVSDVAAAIREQNAVFPAGSLGTPPGTVNNVTIPALTRGRLKEPSDYEKIILRADTDGSMVHLKDVASVELGPDSYNLFGRHNAQPTALILVYQQVGANALDTIKGVRKTMDTLAQSFPPGVTWVSPFDTTPFIERSVKEVARTLLEAIGLVVLVVFIFLQSWRATLIPLLAVPVAIIGTFGGMLAMGFTINTLTLFGLVLAIGIVVDDAIVVVENVERIMHDEGLPPREATIKAMQQVTGPVIAIVLVLIAVFGPVAFLSGLTGALYKQFAVTIAVSVAISGFVALTLTPALCALLLTPTKRAQFFLFRWFDNVFNAITSGFTFGVRQAIRYTLVTLTLFGVLSFAAFRFSQEVPTGLIPMEDQGILLSGILLPDGASLERTNKLAKEVEAHMLAQPAVANVVMLGGFDFVTGGINNPAGATMFASLKPFHERTKLGLRVDDVIASVYKKFAGHPDGVVFAFNMPPIRGLGTQAGFELQLQARNGASPTELEAVARNFITKASDPSNHMFGIRGTLRVTQPQLFVELDRDMAKARGVAVNDVFDTLQTYLGALYVNDFDKFGRIWRVQLQAEPSFRQNPQDIGRLFVRNNEGQMVPLSGIVTTKFQAGPNASTRFNGYPAVQITGAPAQGYSTGQSMATLMKLAKELPPGYTIEWSGASYQEIKAGNQAPYVLAFGILVVFLVLSAQYEKWSLPLAVLLTVPIAILGALVAVKLRNFYQLHFPNFIHNLFPNMSPESFPQIMLPNLDQDIYFQVGLLTLVGLSAKNAILIIEFCLEQHRAGVPAFQAAINAARLRFRPIVMTSLAFILGVVPLAISSGAGAAARHSIATGVIGGMLASTFIAIFFVPMFFVLFTTVTEWFMGLFRTKKTKPTPVASPTGH